jgi:DNA-binding transcriptional MerR regulator
MDLLTVHEVSELANVSVRTLHHYDSIGLLVPSGRTEAGYRLYGESDLLRLHQIMLFRALEFPLADIRRILDSPDFDQRKALDQQIELLEMQRGHIDSLIDLAKAMRVRGVGAMSFKPFDTSKLDEYAAQAKQSWGKSPQWAEYEQKRAGKTKEDERAMGEQLMGMFVPFGKLAAAGADPACEEAQAQVAAIQSFISENFYTCTDEVLAHLGRAYGSGGDFTRNINDVAGAGAAEFAAAAVEAYCASR